MSLTLIGLGLHSEKDLTLGAIEESENSDKVYIEFYTGKWYGNIKSLENLIGKKILQLQRKDLEENSNRIIDEAKNNKIVIFIEGDPLVQTTHSILLTEARKNGIKTKIIHNASIISAIGEAGLHLQKFGHHISIPFPEKTTNKTPQFVFNSIQNNKKLGLHTLCLLDMIAEENHYMTVNEGLNILLSGNTIIKKDRVVVFAKVGSENPTLVYDTVENLMKKNIDDIPAVIIIPGKLHFAEEEFLNQLKP